MGFNIKLWMDKIYNVIIYNNGIHRDYTNQINMNERTNHMKQYYEAYEERYKAVHQLGIQWAEKGPTPIVENMIHKYNISKNTKVLEIGCGEGRDAIYLHNNGYNVYGTDISQEAVNYCIAKSGYKNFFQLDAVNGSTNEKFDYIYAIAVIHMLVLDDDRKKFLQFIKKHINNNGYALICSMGDGNEESETDIRHAFDTVDRIHESSNMHVRVAATSCRKVKWTTFEKEIGYANLNIIEKGTIHDVPGFDSMMYIVVQ